MGISVICDGRILSCDARILRKEKERAAVPFHKLEPVVGVGARAESDHDENKFEPVNDQGFMPTRLSVKRRGVGSLGQVSQAKTRKNGSEMIDLSCYSAKSTD